MFLHVLSFTGLKIVQINGSFERPAFKIQKSFISGHKWSYSLVITLSKQKCINYYFFNGLISFLKFVYCTLNNSKVSINRFNHLINTELFIATLESRYFQIYALYSELNKSWIDFICSVWWYWKTENLDLHCELKDLFFNTTSDTV